MSPLFQHEKRFEPCEPNLSSLPMTAIVGARASLRSGALWTSAILFIAIPLFILWFLIPLLLGEKGASLDFWDKTMIWGTSVVLVVAILGGLSEFRAAWLAGRYRRAITFGPISVAVEDNLGDDTDKWEVPYSAYQGVVLHVLTGELPEHNKQKITLQNSHEARSITLHESKGNGLDPKINEKARIWAEQLKIPALVEIAPGNLVALHQTP
jgi:hypothetical protein